MKGRLFIKIKVLVIITALTLLTGMFNATWWFFVIPIFLFGSYIGIRKWTISAFPIGFLSGFLIWLFMNLFYSYAFNSVVLEQVAQALTLNKILVLFLAGIIGGLLTGLALLAGKHLTSRKQIAEL